MPRARTEPAKKQETVTPALFEAKEPEPIKEPFEQKVEEEPELIDGMEKVSAEVAAKVKAAEGTPLIESKPEPKPEPKPDEAALALQRQVDELRRSEQIQQQRIREYEQRLAQTQKESEEKDEVAVNAGLEAAQNAIAKAVSDIKNAETDGDIEAKTEAYRRLARAENHLEKWENAKEEVEARKKAPPQQAQQPVPQYPPGSDAEINSWQVPEREKIWAREHRDWVTDLAKRDKMARVTIYLAEVHGIRPGHDDFIPRLEAEIGIKKQEQPQSKSQPEPEPEPQRRSIVSAPVSREVPSGSGSRQPGKVTLTADQKEAAKIAGVTEVEYARQLMKINQMKEAGTYGGDVR